MNSLEIVIADFPIKLHSDYQISLEEGYQPFLQQPQKEVQDTAVNIYCYAGIPENQYREEELVFEAKNEVQRFYSIYRSGTDLVFVIFNQQTQDQIQQVAILDETYSNWKVYSELSSDGRLFPLRYPMGPIMMYYLTVKSDAIMMHASGIFDGSKGRIFTGFSGAGKSTMSKLWAGEGSLIVNDDRLIIRKQDKGFYIYNTPMFYRDIPKEAPLQAIHLIRHSPENEVKRISGARATSKVLAFCIQNNFDKSFVLNHLNFVSEMCTQIAVYETGFVPDASIVNFINEHEV